MLQGTRVDTCEGQGAVTVVHDLERQRTQRLFWIHRGNLARFVTVDVHLRLRLDLRRIRQEVNHCIKNILYTFVFKGRTTVGREEVQSNRTLANALLNVVDRGFIAFEVLLE